MTFLASSATALYQQIQLWTGRANNAWGASRVWNSGQSFETDRNAAYDGGSWGSGNLWSVDAHNDPNVWTNRYNAGYTDGAASKTTTAASATPAASSQKTAGQLTGVLATLVAPRAGLGHLSCYTRVNRHNSNAGNFSVQMQLYRNGSLVATGPIANCGDHDSHDGISADWSGSCSVSDSFTVQCLVNSTPGGNSADFDGTGSMTLSVGSI